MASAIRSAKIMGIINCSPDSFFASSQGFDSLLARAEAMVAAGVDILDCGGEATNPNVVIRENGEAKALLECERVLPVIEAVKQRFDCEISVDTSQPTVMREAVSAGASMINDQRSLRVDGALEAAKNLDVQVVLMHQGDLMGERPQQASEAAVQQIIQESAARADEVIAAGVSVERLILDPGFGQGHFKGLSENLVLLARLSDLVALGYPVLAGWSRKSMISDIVGGCEVDHRLPGSLAGAILAYQQGAAILRVHDVVETIQALKVVDAVDTCINPQCFDRMASFIS